MLDADMASTGGSESCREGLQVNLCQIVGLEVVRSKIKRDRHEALKGGSGRRGRRVFAR